MSTETPEPAGLSVAVWRACQDDAARSLWRSYFGSAWTPVIDAVQSQTGVRLGKSEARKLARDGWVATWGFQVTATISDGVVRFESSEPSSFLAEWPEPAAAPRVGAEQWEAARRAVSDLPLQDRSLAQAAGQLEPIRDAVQALGQDLTLVDAARLVLGRPVGFGLSYGIRATPDPDGIYFTIVSVGVRGGGGGG